QDSPSVKPAETSADIGRSPGTWPVTGALTASWYGETCKLQPVFPSPHPASKARSQCPASDVRQLQSHNKPVLSVSRSKTESQSPESAHNRASGAVPKAPDTNHRHACGFRSPVHNCGGTGNTGDRELPDCKRSTQYVTPSIYLNHWHHRKESHSHAIAGSTSAWEKARSQGLKQDLVRRSGASHQ